MITVSQLLTYNRLPIDDFCLVNNDSCLPTDDYCLPTGDFCLLLVAPVSPLMASAYIHTGDCSLPIDDHCPPSDDYLLPLMSSISLLITTVVLLMTIASPLIIYVPSWRQLSPSL